MAGAFPLLTPTSPLQPGDMAPQFAGRGQRGEALLLDEQGGDPVALFFLPGASPQHTLPVLEHLRRAYDAFAAAGIIPWVVLCAPVETEKLEEYPFGLIVDEGGATCRRYGVLEHNPATPETPVFKISAFVLGVDGRVRAILRAGKAVDKLVDETLEHARRLNPQPKLHNAPMHAPVLQIPHVLSRAECAFLIRMWEEEGNVESGVMRTIGGKTVGVYDHSHKIRHDHFIKKPEVMQHLDIVMRRRVFPEIKKAFAFECSRREEYKIACYDGARGGFFTRHRDNRTKGTAHRVWAMSLNLNAEEYEGGHLRFAEFGGGLYKPDTGGAVVFSGALMHEATPVTEGRRFVLLNFFYGDKEAELRAQNKRYLVQE